MSAIKFVEMSTEVIYVHVQQATNWTTQQVSYEIELLELDDPCNCSDRQVGRAVTQEVKSSNLEPVKSNTGCLRLAAAATFFRKKLC